MVVYFYIKTNGYQKKWLDLSLYESLRKIPAVDTFCVEVLYADIEKMKEFGATSFPCVFVYRMGHLVDTIFPAKEDGIVRDQIREYEIMNQMQIDAEERKIKDYSKEGLRTDEDRLAFEQRAREREMESKKKDMEAQKRYEMEVRRKIEQDRKERKLRQKKK